MLPLKFYKDVLLCKNSDEVFNFIIQNLKPSNTLWSYFVDWGKVFSNAREIEIGLNTFNYLIGKKNFDLEFKELLREHPDLIKIIPALAVSRDHKFEVLVDFSGRKLKYESYDFSKTDTSDSCLDKYLKFVSETGLKSLIQSGKIKSLVDYMIGVEAGLDSNGRKNRSGHSMEEIVGAFIADVCARKSFQFLKEANAAKIKSELYVDIPVEESSRRYDYVIKTSENIYLIETNFYGDSGSKLKSTAGEYRNLYDTMRGHAKFIWITDGLGWLKTAHPLKDTFEHNDYIFSLAMLEKGILDHVLK